MSDRHTMALASPCHSEHHAPRTTNAYVSMRAKRDKDLGDECCQHESTQDCVLVVHTSSLVVVHIIQKAIAY